LKNVLEERSKIDKDKSEKLVADIKKYKNELEIYDEKERESKIKQ